MTVTLGKGGATVAAKLVRALPVGIFVERIVGRHLVPVGRVPFGRHRNGRLRVRWNLRVGGHKLPKGRYWIRLRALDAHGRVIGLAPPVTIVIH